MKFKFFKKGYNTAKKALKNMAENSISNQDSDSASIEPSEQNSENDSNHSAASDKDFDKDTQQNASSKSDKGASLKSYAVSVEFSKEISNPNEGKSKDGKDSNGDEDSNGDKDSKGGKNSKDEKNANSDKDSNNHKDSKGDGASEKDQDSINDKDSQERNDSKSNKNSNDDKKSKDDKSPKDGKDSKDDKSPKDGKDSKDDKSPKDGKDSKGNKSSKDGKNSKGDNSPNDSKDADSEFHKAIQVNMDTLGDYFKNCQDVIFREFEIYGDVKAFVLYADGLSDKELISNGILKPLMVYKKVTDSELPDAAGIKDKILLAPRVSEISTMKDLEKGLFTGFVFLFVDGIDKPFSFGMEKNEHKSISVPDNEVSILGSKESFTEIMAINISMIRRRIKSTIFKQEFITVGKFTNTNISVCYLEGVVNKKVLEEVKKRLNNIDTNIVLDGGSIRDYLETYHLSVFPQVIYTERPDKTLYYLSQGRVALIIDGSPVSLIVPGVFQDAMHSIEDQLDRSLFVSFVRMVRYLFMFISIFTPAIYIAIINYNVELIPTLLLVKLIQARAVIPFPTIVELLILEIAFEGLREAGLRLPKPIGQTVSIVGGLIIGDAAVRAGLVSPAMVIIVALTGIASFTVPGYSTSTGLRLVRFPIFIIASIFGVYGIMMASIVLFVYLSSLDSFGVSYLAPLSPAFPKDIKDSFVKFPNDKINPIPDFLAEMNTQKEGYQSE